MPRPQDQGNQKEHLKRALNFLIRQKYFSESGHNVKHLNLALAKLKTNNPNWDTNISHLEIPIQDEDFLEHDPKIIIGGIIQAKENEIVYSTFSVTIIFTTEAPKLSSHTSTLNVPSCCLKDHASKKRIVRHFHFDFQPESGIEPVSHFQYGGPFLEDGPYGDCHYCLEHKLKIPRIFFPPMDIVLILDLIIREFSTPISHFAEEGEWRNIVFESQKIWWKQYWDDSKRYLSDAHGMTFLESIYSDVNES